MKLYKTIVYIVSLFILCFCCTKPVYAIGSSATPSPSSDGSTIEIEMNGSDGITISPGVFPDLGSDVEDAQKEAGKLVISKGREIAQTITAICALIALTSFFVHAVRLSTSGSMPFLRRQAIIGLLWSGVAIMLFGGAWVVVSFFWNFLRT